MPESSIRDARTATTFRDDAGFSRTALIIDAEQKDCGSIDLVTPEGEFLARINIFTNERYEWLAVDTIDVGNRYLARYALVFINGQRSMMEAQKTVGADFRGLRKNG